MQSLYRMRCAAPHEPQVSEMQFSGALKLLLAHLDHGDVKTVAMKLLPEYKKLCATTIDCEELHSALRRLYLTRYSELQLALHRMDKLGLLLRRVPLPRQPLGRGPRPRGRMPTVGPRRPVQAEGRAEGRRCAERKGAAKFFPRRLGH